MKAKKIVNFLITTELLALLSVSPQFFLCPFAATSLNNDEARTAINQNISSNKIESNKSLPKIKKSINNIVSAKKSSPPTIKILCEKTSVTMSKAEALPVASLIGDLEVSENSVSHMKASLSFETDELSVSPAILNDTDITSILNAVEDYGNGLPVWRKNIVYTALASVGRIPYQLGTDKRASYNTTDKANSKEKYSDIQSAENPVYNKNYDSSSSVTETVSDNENADYEQYVSTVSDNGYDTMAGLDYDWDYQNSIQNSANNDENNNSEAIDADNTASLSDDDISQYIHVTDLNIENVNDSIRTAGKLDCSHWVDWVYGTAIGDDLGWVNTDGLISLNGYQLYDMGTAESVKSSLQPGDIMVFGHSSKRGYGHAAIFLGYVSENNGGAEMMYVHESSAAHNVAIHIGNDFSSGGSVPVHYMRYIKNSGSK